MLAVLGLGGVPVFTASTPRLSTTGSSSLHASTAGAGTAAPVAMCVMSNTQVEAAEVASNAEERGECSSLRLLRSVGDKGEQIGQFNGPRHIAALPGGQGVCLVDGLNERVLVLDAEGECVRCVDGMATPTGVAIEDDTLWWAESTGAHRVKRLRLSARSMSTAADANVGKRVVDVQRPWAAKAISAGGLGSASGELHDPSCLCVSGDLPSLAADGDAARLVELALAVPPVVPLCLLRLARPRDVTHELERVLVEDGDAVVALLRNEEQVAADAQARRVVQLAVQLIF